MQTLSLHQFPCKAYQFLLLIVRISIVKMIYLFFRQWCYCSNKNISLDPADTHYKLEKDHARIDACSNASTACVS